jgi:hypothetical protein
MPIADKDQVRQQLERRHPLFVEVVMTAWDRWQRNPERAQLYRRSRSCLMHNYMMLHAVPLMQADDGTYVKERHETALFFMDQKLVVRFKKGDVKGLSSNIGTQAALAFNDPNENLELFDLPDVARVDVAYVLNDLETKIQDILIVAREDERVLWSYSILQDTATGTLPSIGTNPAAPPPADSGIRVPGDEDADENEVQSDDGRK